jgi:hypothetical protein
MQRSGLVLLMTLSHLVACSPGGTAEATPPPEAATTASEQAAATPQDECIAVLTAQGDAIQALFDNVRSLHPQSNTAPVTPVAELRMNATDEQLSAIYGALHGSEALVTASASVRGAERPIRVSDGIVNLTYAWNNTFTHTVAGREIEVQTGSVINTDTQDEIEACFIELVESFGEAGEVRIELALAR